jgi:DNA-binding response OmpR family regulator
MRAHSARILIVDGRRDASDEIARVLAAQGYRVRQATDASEAVSALHQERTDLALIEVNLPGWIDGASLARYLAGREIPIVMMSDVAAPDERLVGLPYPHLRKEVAAAEAGGAVERALSAAYGTS